MIKPGSCTVSRCKSVPTRPTLLLLAASLLLEIHGTDQLDARASQGAPEAALLSGHDRTFSLVNQCSYTVWPTARGAVQVTPPGLALGPGASANVSVPHGWFGNWSPRIGCRFNASGQGPCDTGGCGNSLICEEDNSVVPLDRTQAEFNLNAWGNLDYYDVNLFTYNAAVSITPSNPACRSSGCTGDLLEDCPGGGAVTDGRGTATICRSACAQFLDVEHCLAASPISARTKQKCPFGTVSYMTDPNQTMACAGSPDYTVTFCGYVGAS